MDRRLLGHFSRFWRFPHLAKYLELRGGLSILLNQSHSGELTIDMAGRRAWARVKRAPFRRARGLGRRTAIPANAAARARPQEPVRDLCSGWRSARVFREDLKFADHDPVLAVRGSTYVGDTSGQQIPLV